MCKVLLLHIFQICNSCFGIAILEAAYFGGFAFGRHVRCTGRLHRFHFLLTYILALESRLGHRILTPAPLINQHKSTMFVVQRSKLTPLRLEHVDNSSVVFFSGKEKNTFFYGGGGTAKKHYGRFWLLQGTSKRWVVRDAEEKKRGRVFKGTMGSQA